MLQLPTELEKQIGMTSEEAADIMALLSQLSGYFEVKDRWGYQPRCREAATKMKELSIKLLSLA